MKFPNSFLDELRQRIPISQIIGQRVKFDRAKSNKARGDHWACCPFHHEKTPSFHCDDRKGSYYCFGCNAAGDHIKFLREIDNLSFVEAVEKLAAEAGVKVPVMDKAEAEREKKKASLFDVMTLAVKFFQDALQDSQGAKARAYLRDRGIDPALQEKFAIGYAPPEKNALKNYLTKQNIPQQQIEACGLVVFGPDIAVSYDRFRDRIMFPITDPRERVIAFGGRALSPDVPAKYINSPQTDLFSKSNVLYNFAQARKACKKNDNLIIAEGYMDVIALHKAGFENAVAPLGTALTPIHLQLAWRVGKNPFLCFDGDDAGLRAAHRTIDICLEKLQSGYSTYFTMLPSGKDPDDFINENGAQAFEALLKQSTSLVDMLWSREAGAATFETPEQRSELEQNFRTILNTIQNDSVKRHYQQYIKQRLAGFFGSDSYAYKNKKQFANDGTTSYNVSYNDKKFQASNKQIVASKSLLNSPLMQNPPSFPKLRETILVMTIANHPQIGLDYADEFDSLNLTTDSIRNFKTILLDILSNAANEEINASTIRQHINDLALTTPFERLQQQLRDNRMWECLDSAETSDAKQGWLQALYLYRKENLDHALKQATNDFAENGDESSYKRLVSIKEEIWSHDNIPAIIEDFGEKSGRQIRSF